MLNELCVHSSALHIIQERDKGLVKSHDREDARAETSYHLLQWKRYAKKITEVMDAVAIDQV